jgi:hypothetical protein
MTAPTLSNYQSYCGGRLLQVTEMIDVTPTFANPDALREYLYGEYHWVVDGHPVGRDVAALMLDAHREEVLVLDGRVKL